MDIGQDGVQLYQGLTDSVTHIVK